MESYYLQKGRHYPRVTRNLLEAITATPDKAATAEAIANAVGETEKPDRVRNMLARLRARLLLRSHGRPALWVLTPKGHAKLAWLREQEPEKGIEAKSEKIEKKEPPKSGGFYF